MKKCLFALLLATTGMSISLAPAFAQNTEASAPKKAVKKPVKKAVAKKPVAKAVAKEQTEEEKEPDITGSTTTDYKCELGNSLTIYENLADDKHVALRWKKKLMRMDRVETTTGAKRFENRNAGLVWIGIPAKGILLDKKKGLQLANECKNAEQMIAQPATTESAPALGITTAPPVVPTAAPVTAAPASSLPATPY